MCLLPPTNLPPPLTNQEREQDVREQGVRPPMGVGGCCGARSCVWICVCVCVCAHASTCICVHGSVLGALSRLSVKEGSSQSLAVGNTSCVTSFVSHPPSQASF